LGSAGIFDGIFKWFLFLQESREAWTDFAGNLGKTWPELEEDFQKFKHAEKTNFVLRKNQLSSIYYLCGIAYFYVARKWF
jgi:hypothetical protein